MSSAKLLYENAANWQYATGTGISDPSIWYQSASGQNHIIVSELEIALMQQKATFDFIHSYGQIKKDLGDKPLTIVNMVHWLQTKEPTAPIAVPSDFPSALLEKLRESGLTVNVIRDELFFPERAIKRLDEIEKLAAAQRLNDQCFHRAFQVLREADIAKDLTLIWKGQPLTSELMQQEMRIAALRLGASDFHHVEPGPVVACGIQGTMPHERGHGPLKANELIVIDSFPRHPNGYWGDCTRTALKGQASQWQKDVYAAVLAAQQLALSLVKDGANGKDIHQAVVKSFNQAGFPSGSLDDGTPYGFFHGTGHGVGLELHDPGPRMIGGGDCILKSGYVTSVEPGLYYPPGSSKGGVGGCRIEDTVVVTPSGHTNFAGFPTDRWIID